jgi:hypothetical protein
MNTPNAAPVYDADTIVNLKNRPVDDAIEELNREALTDAGREIGIEVLSG